MESTVTITRTQRLEMLEQYFLKKLVEDPVDGTSFDCDILDNLKTLKKKYKNE